MLSLEDAACTWTQKLTASSPVSLPISAGGPSNRLALAKRLFHSIMRWKCSFHCDVSGAKIFLTLVLINASVEQAQNSGSNFVLDLPLQMQEASGTDALLER
jgi:hypothetical protein